MSFRNDKDKEPTPQQSMVSNNGHDPSACHECAINTSNTQPELLQMSALPKGPWMNPSLDFCGPGQETTW